MRGRKPVPVEQRFGKFVEKLSTGCWAWIGHKNEAGYGLILYNGKATLAHRVSWIIHNGDIPNGVKVLHKCDNPPCTNPQHLWLGSHKDNVRDRQRKGRSAIGSKNGNSKLDRQKVKAIRAAIANGEDRRVIAVRYGVDSTNITLIVQRKTWREVE